MRAKASLVVILGGIAVLAASGCGSSSSNRVTLPAKVAPSASSTATTVAQAAVVAAYTTFWSLDGTAERSSAVRAEQMLAPYVAQPYLGHLLAQMGPYRQRHEEAWGHVIPHITQVTVMGDQALVRDCQDQSHAALANTQTGRVIPHTTGSSRTSYVASLKRGSDGLWRLTALEQLAQSCEPGSSPS